VLHHLIEPSEKEIVINFQHAIGSAFANYPTKAAEQDVS